MTLNGQNKNHELGMHQRKNVNSRVSTKAANLGTGAVLKKKQLLAVRHWNCAAGDKQILISLNFSLSSEQTAEFVFLGTTASTSLFYSLILIQSGKT
jgi:hypothetical protein